MNRKKDILQLYNQLFQFLFILKNMWGRYYIAAIKKGLYINILFFTLIYLYGCDSKIKKIQPFILPFSKVTKSVDVAFQGIQLLCTDTAIKLKIIRSGFNYLNTHFGNTISFDIGLASLSLYYATGETKYLEQAKETAALLDSLVLKNGLIPEYYLNKKVNPNSILYPGTWGQSNTLCFICALSEIDSSYKTLCKKLADGLLTYGLNHKNNLAYFQVYAISGQPYNSKEFGYESQLGSSSCAISQSLLFVYKLFPTEKKYLNESLKILKSIWNLRDRETNLISECYDVYNNKKAERLYPANQFRYDDMGGSYIRALTFAYQISGDKEIQAILNQYIEALLKYTWDERLGGGAFRYLSDVTGHGTPQVETMYGLFIASLIESSQYVNNNIKKVIIEKCSEHADNIYLTDFGVKNFMIPHNISQDGRYTAKTNDSQLAYAVIQFPLGMSLLTQATNNYNYIYRTNRIINTLLEKHKMGDNIRYPMGFVNILETQPPYNFETDYSDPSWCFQAMYLPSYMLFASIIPNTKVKINWLFDNAPCVFGLVTGMPYWDLKKVRFKIKNKRLDLNDVNSEYGGEINFELLGYQKITKAFVDGNSYFLFHNNKLTTKMGHHSYQIYFD